MFEGRAGDVGSCWLFCCTFSSNGHIDNPVDWLWPWQVVIYGFGVSVVLFWVVTRMDGAKRSASAIGSMGSSHLRCFCEWVAESKIYAVPLRDAHVVGPKDGPCDVIPGLLKMLYGFSKAAPCAHRRAPTVRRSQGEMLCVSLRQSIGRWISKASSWGRWVHAAPQRHKTTHMVSHTQ